MQAGAISFMHESCALDTGGIQTHTSEGTIALIQHVRRLSHTTPLILLRVLE